MKSRQRNKKLLGLNADLEVERSDLADELDDEEV
jgi:hypothetical protein